MSWKSTLHGRSSSLPARIPPLRAGKSRSGSRSRKSWERVFSTKTSRFKRDLSISEHLGFLIRNLKEAAKIFEDHKVYYVIENHCDFAGREFVRIFEAVDSTHAGSALDTGNGYTVYWDPNDDVDVLAPYAITTHIKDMRVEDYESDLIPFQARGCALGEGHVDIPRVLELLETYSPRAEGWLI